jgi:hypothetical protein
MPPGVAAPVIHGSVAVANETAQPIELEFGGCASALIEVVDSAGHAVITTRTDDGGCCTCDRLLQVKLVHDTLTLPFTFKLENIAGPLADGHYAVRVRLLTFGAAPAIEATTAIEVRSVH